jgi:hypothetical protein
MVNKNKPTTHSRHIDIQFFAIQEWRSRGLIKLVYIPTYFRQRCRPEHQGLGLDYAFASCPTCHGALWSSVIAVSPSIYSFLSMFLLHGCLLFSILLQFKVPLDSWTGGGCWNKQHPCCSSFRHLRRLLF